MKLFVTAAQEVAMRNEIREEILRAHQQAFQVTLAAHETRHAAELARLIDPQGPFVAHLTAEVAFWRAQVIHYRQRVEVAIDVCRVTHQGVGPISLPPRETEGVPPRALTKEEKMFLSPELAAMGLADGV